MSLRVAIDATPLLVRSAGVKGYLWHWIQAMRKSAGSSAIRAFPFIGALPPLQHDRSIYSNAGTLARIAALHGSNKIPGVIELLTAGASVFHSSNLIRRKPAQCRLSATIHDLTSWSHAAQHMTGTLRLDFDFAEHVLKQADGLIAVSDNTRHDAIEYLKIPPKRIRRIYSGVPAPYFNVTAHHIEAARTALGLPKPYVLYVGTIEPRKNLDRLLEAWSSLPDNLLSETELVIAGPYGWGSEATLAQLRSHPKGCGTWAMWLKNTCPG